ncbi:ATP-binding protein [Anabaena sp. PCC 7108]|uniref:ATP-binding protein n=1 Tax=Anabaena sp. PCC 7108 TaxID=163908 RepID=UPI00034C1813|nr:DUF87 domain-containing protein [Anabaena sp. PCC 7108]
MFGLKIAFIPDFLLDHTLLGKERPDRIQEYFGRWNQFVSGLWRSTEDVTYALRFDLNQTHKNIDTYFLGRLRTADIPEGAIHANILLNDLERMLSSFGFEPQLLAKHELQDLSENYNYRFSLEVSQQEVKTFIREDTPIVGEKSNSLDSEFSLPKEFIYHHPEQKIPLNPLAFYGVRFWWGAGGTFLTPFNAIACQKSAVSVLILLTPTVLKAEEAKLMSDVARQSESLAQMQTKGTNFGNAQVNPSQSKTDPQLRWESRLYAANLRRLTTYPFLTTLFCFSDDQAAGEQVAAAFAASIREERQTEPPLGESEPIPSGSEISLYENSSHLQKVRQYLIFDPLILKLHSKKAPHDALRRLRYLMDARGAGSVFRFPISIEGGVPGIPVKQRPPDFHPGSRNEEIPSDAIDLGRFHVGGRAYLSKNAFTKHALITGFTGSGKSNTSLYLLDQFWRKLKIPFLVIESAKKEYRGLRNVDVFQNQLLIYTLGNENIAPLRFNPFELIEGVRVESHLANLQTCFEGALPPVGPLSSIISEGLEVIYRQYGWRLTDYGRSADPRQFPTMEDFYVTVEQVLKERGYQGEVKSNLEAAIKGRIKPLLMGSKGLMFSSSRSHPSAEILFSHPVILELNDLNEQDKSLVMMFFLTLLREYRELHTSKELAHITLVEEAHNVLENVASTGNQEGGGSDVKAKSVQAFCNMLAEVRAYGEGLIIADQSPEKLARDAMRNTNVQIAHQLRDAHDREAIANAMIMSEEQRDFLGKCETGRAAVFYTGLQKATFIDIPVYKDKLPPTYEGKSAIENRWRGFDDDPSPHVSDLQVRDYMSQFINKEPKNLNCSLCQVKCNYRDRILELAEISKSEFKNALDKFNQANSQSKVDEFTKLGKVILESTNVNNMNNLDLAWCYTKEMWFRLEKDLLDDDDKKQFMIIFTKIVKQV